MTKENVEKYYNNSYKQKREEEKINSFLPFKDIFFLEEILTKNIWKIVIKVIELSLFFSFSFLYSI